MSSEAHNEFAKTLYNLYQEFIEEKNEIVNQMKAQEFKISEIENQLTSIHENEDLDYKIFSPRESYSLYKEKKEQLLSEKESLDVLNTSYEKQLAIINNRIQSIKSVIDNFYSCYTTNITNNQDVINSSTKYRDSYIMLENYKKLNVKEKEQQRIARDLHDSALQTLTHVIHKTELCSKFISQDPVRAKLELATITKYLKEAVQEIRNAIFDLHPMSMDDLGLKGCLENLFTVLQQDSNIKIDYEIDDIKECTDTLLLLNIFHIVQESVRNSIKHSEGTRIFASIKENDDKIYIRIEDNGKGFDLETIEKKEGKHFGLSILKERAALLNGEFSIESKIDEGTIIEIVMTSKIV